MDDYPVEEARVMRGDDDRIQPAVACAVAMGFGEADATEAAKRVIVAFPGRANVEELVVDALLADSGGGARAFELPKTMPRAYADGARAVPGTIADGSVEAAIDLTGEPSPDAPPAKRPRGGAAPEGKGKAPATDVVDDDDAKPANDANDLVRQLAAERHARDAARGGPAAPGRFAAAPRSTAGDANANAAGVGAGGAGGSGGSRGGLTGAAARAAATAAASSSFGGSGIIDALLAGTSEPLKAPLKEVRVLTYNVWFAEHVALADRVQGLSDVVVQSDPHVLCLQEVTPNILMLLHAMPWFEAYKCTPPPAQQYFTVVLFKQSLHKGDKTTRLVRRNFPNSRMGRYADGVAGIECGGGRELTVMSSHLESFISKTQTSSAERVAQLKDALRVLDGIVDRRAAERERARARGDALGEAAAGAARGGVRNALFAGDTNWDEKTDGKTPLPSGWEDAWLLKGDGGPGYTYDLKRNAMMSGVLQKRLDRVFCRLEDFRVASFEMVGTTPVTRRDGSPATYVNEWKGRAETKMVLPSDHFGVLVTLEAVVK